ncbi:MAG TPA: HemK2/MTQ2 family protein methyltransferase [Bacteroidota bacterium]|nr:HemK2/MTQ2 family protein methyltransferase [Bacteroidota bacterium]
METAHAPAAPGLRGTLPLRLLRRGSHVVALHLFVRRAMAREDNVSMFGIALRVPPTVFHPRFSRTSRFFGRYIRAKELRGAEVLEIGCGSGILSLVAARAGARVTALDINPRAVEATATNARMNKLDACVRVMTSDLFERIPRGTTFDRIVWNPPFYPAEQSDDASRAWNAGRSYGVIARFAASAGDYLRPGGTIMLVTSTDAGEREILAELESAGFTPALRSRSRGFFETLSIFEFARTARP